MTVTTMESSVIDSKRAGVTPSRQGRFPRRLPILGLRRRRGLDHFVLLLLSLWTFLLPPASWAQHAKPTDYEVKAVYLYNFGKFVSFPQRISSGTGKFNLCILGKDPFGPKLDATVSDESVGGKTVAVMRLARTQDAGACQIIFVSESESERLKSILEALHPVTALTVSDIPGFLTQGGMIEFVIEDNRVRFEVNLDAAQRAGLTLSSELLKVALDVKRQGGH